MNEWFRKYKVQIIIGAVCFLILNYISYYFRVTFEGNAISGVDMLFSKPSLLLYAFPLSINIIDLFLPLFLTGMLLLVINDKKNNKKVYRKGVEYGSARWGNVEKDLEGMYDSTPPVNGVDNNIIFSQNTKIALNDNKIDFKFRRNKNVAVAGGSGSGKTRFFVKPNMLQMNASFVCTDPKGTIVNEIGMALRYKGNYKIKILNTVSFSKSMKYNPLHYVKNEQDILKLVETIISNTSGQGAVKEDFWVKSEKLLYQAYLSLIQSVFPKEEQNLSTLMEMLSFSSVDEKDDTFKNEVDVMFEDLESVYPDHFAVKQYRAYKLAAGKTAKSILISCAARLSPLNIPAVRDLLSEDELQLDTLGNKGRKTALFVIVPDTDATFNFIVAIMYSQLFNMLCTIADEEHRGSLPTHVRFMLDEFANIGVIPNFDKLIATIRSRNISATIILQTFAQLDALYEKNADTIIGNCDTTIFLGGKEKKTVKSISEELGKETINDYNESRTRSNSDSYGQNYSKLGRALMTEDELLTMDRDKCIVQIIGLHPFKDQKYDLEKHRFYPFHYQKKTNKYWFDIDKYLEAIRTPKQSQLENTSKKVPEIAEVTTLKGKSIAI